eukprot:TRINITY_DN74688_c0_g1_i1.p1 TRINITY_DN74688_c0_g1~~TRINITY_DN74688_c0_g1_i1.p1  ORF type:complete len:362 (-),score=26.31 TRINITY_DN74688_c0_g1_i1:840-1787(-)
MATETGVCKQKTVPHAPRGPFGAWASDSDTLSAIQEALAHGRPVVIENAFEDAKANHMRNELVKVVQASAGDPDLFVRGGTPATKAADIQDDVFRNTSLEKLCSTMESFNEDGFQFRGHGLGARVRDDVTKIPKLIELVRYMGSGRVRGWITELLQLTALASPSSQIVDFGSNLYWFQPGDFFGMHNDMADTRQVVRTLSFTYYLGPPANDGGWQESWGGRFVWCREATNSTERQMAPPVHVSPGFNTLVLFRVDMGTKHFVERVFQTASEALQFPRLSMQGWWSSKPPRGAQEQRAWKAFQEPSSVMAPLVVRH